MNNIKIFYFQESKNFIFVSNDYINYFHIYKINETSFSITNYDIEHFSECQITNSFTLLYNQSMNSYNLISDCVTGYRKDEWNIIHNISIFTELSPIMSPPTDLILEINDTEEEFYIYEEESYVVEEDKKIEKEIINEEVKTEMMKEIEKKEEIKKNEMNITKDELIKDLGKLVNEIEIGKNYEYIGEDFDLLIKPTK